MKYTILTLFPDIIDVYFASSIMAKAIQRGIVAYRSINIRDFAFDRHRSCDDAPYGGGPGMLMLPGPVSLALEAAGARKKGGGAAGPEDEDFVSNDNEKHNPGLEPGGISPHTIYLTPSGRPFTQKRAAELAQKPELVFLCGRYEGIDQRIIDIYVDEEISVGDYVLSSGEVAALAVIDAVYRLVDRVITPSSLEEESFSGGLLEYPQYTRPEIFDTLKVPGVLLSGHHENIRRWRLGERIRKTLAVRPGLIDRGLKEGLFDRETARRIEEEREKAGFSPGENG